jgi:heterodisulfide reductase subunit A
MRESIPKIGVYVCHCGTNISGKVDVEAVAEHASRLPYVAIARNFKFMCSSPGQQLVMDDIRKNGLNRVVVASCSPRMHEKTFRNACQSAGINPYHFQMACIREHDSWVTEDRGDATEKAKDLVRGAVARVSHHQALSSRVVDITPNVLVIGGGIAGMQAALEIADAGRKVYLVEREPSLGGNMSKFDKTFPTLDCAACISTPKLVAVGQHPNIELMTYSEVVDVSGFVGNFTVKVRRKPRYVDADKCTGCGVCSEKCPTKVLSEFDHGLTYRKAIYTPFPQSVPNTRVIDAAHCLFFTKGRCRACEKFCEAKAVNFDQKEQIVEIQAGAIIIATGFETFDPTPLSQYGFGRYPEVYTSIQFERINNATGPTSGEILTKDGKKPEAVAIVHCVGSRDRNHMAYCSRVCCMYSMKFAHLVREKTGAEVYEFYIDIRSPGKGYEAFYNRLQEEGTHFIRGKVSQVTDMAQSPAENGKLVVVAEDTLARKVRRIPVDMVVLSVGLKPASGIEDIARMVGISLDSDGWINELHPKLGPLATASDGIFIAGCCQGPKDIPDSVAQGQGAAGEALSLIGRGKLAIEAAVSYIDPERCMGCRQCEAVCFYGAISYNAVRDVCEVNEAICKGCGNCAATCPNKAIELKHFNNDQLLAEMEGVLFDPVEYLQGLGAEAA